MIQDLGSHCYHNEYHPVPPRDNDYILFFHGRQALVKISGDTFTFPDFQYAGKYYPQIYTSYTYLFSIDERNYYLPKESSMEELPGYSMEDIIIFRNLSPQVNCFALITGYQLCNWYETRKFCGKCGHISDFNWPEGVTLPQNMISGEVVHMEIRVVGLCPECRLAADSPAPKIPSEE